MLLGGDILGGFFEKFTSIPKFIESAFAAPSIVPIGATAKFITKTPGLVKGIIVGGGVVAAATLLGGGGQEQQAAIDAPIIQAPEAKQDVTQAADARNKMLMFLRDIKQRQDLDIIPSVDSSTTTRYGNIRAGGDIDVGGTTHLTTTTTTTYAGQGVDLSPLQLAAAENKNLLEQVLEASSTPSIVQEQTKTTDWVVVALIIGGAYFLTGGLKRGKR